MKQQIQKLFKALIICIASQNSLFAVLQNGFFQYKTGEHSSLVLVNTTRLENQIPHELQHFKKLAFETPEYLAYAHTHNQDIIFIIDDVFGEISQLNPQAAITEGSRVALTWLSAHYRFATKPLDNIRVFVVSHDVSLSEEDDIHAIISGPRDQNTTQTKNIEEKFESYITRIKPFKHDNQESFTLQPITLDINRESPVRFDIGNVPVSDHKQRIVITGAAGFLGSHLSKKILDEGHTVIGLDNLSCCSGKNLEELLKSSRFHFIKHDISNSYDFNEPIDIIIHAASVPSPEYYYKMPVETLRSGLHGIDNALELAYKYNARCMFTSTSEVYGDPSISPQPESYAGNVSPIGKRSQYDESKRGAETLIWFSYKQKPIDIRIARIFNTYGPGMELNDGRVITNFIQATLSEKPLTIYGSGLQTRSFCYVDDLIAGLFELTVTEKINQDSSFEDRIFNVGNPHEFTVNECASIMQEISQKHLNYQPTIRWIANPDATDPKQRKPDITRARELLGFEPKINLYAGLEKTFLHFKDLQ